MFRIRRQHRAAFVEAAVRDFEKRMVAHLRECFSEQCADLGDEELRAIVAYGRERAALYGIDLERHVCLYIDLMFGVGRDFDEDPALPARQILVDPAIHPIDRIDRVYDAVLGALPDGG